MVVTKERPTSSTPDSDHGSYRLVGDEIIGGVTHINHTDDMFNKLASHPDNADLANIDIEAVTHEEDAIRASAAHSETIPGKNTDLSLAGEAASNQAAAEARAADQTPEEQKEVKTFSNLRYRTMIALGAQAAITSKIIGKGFSKTLGRLKMFKTGGRFEEVGENMQENGMVKVFSTLNEEWREKNNEKRAATYQERKLGSWATAATAAGVVAGFATAGASVGAKYAVRGAIGASVGAGRTFTELRGKDTDWKTVGKSMGKNALIYGGIATLSSAATMEFMGRGTFNKGGQNLASKAFDSIKDWGTGGNTANIPTESYNVVPKAYSRPLTVDGHGSSPNPKPGEGLGGTVQRSKYGPNVETLKGPHDWGDIFGNEKHTVLENAKINSGRIAEAMANHDPNDPIIGYSQGSIDTVQYLVDHPNHKGPVVLMGTPFGIDGVPGRGGMSDEVWFEAVKKAVPDTYEVLRNRPPNGENVTIIIRQHDAAGGLGKNPFGWAARALDKNMHAYSPQDLNGETPRVTIHGKNGETMHILTETMTRNPLTGENFKSGTGAGLHQHGFAVSKKGDAALDALEGRPTDGKIDGVQTRKALIDAANEAAPGTGKVLGDVVSPDIAQGLAQTANTGMDQGGQIVETIAASPAVQEGMRAAAPVIQATTAAIHGGQPPEKVVANIVNNFNIPGVRLPR